MSAADAFVPLAELLQPSVADATVTEEHPPEAIVATEPADVAPMHESIGAIREARRFRARLADALDARLARLLAAIASEILMREVRTSPADLAALVARIVDEQAAPPLQVRVSAADRDALAACAIDVVEDRSLEPGDAIVTFAAGEIDARLGVRLAAVLEACR
jgi:flagellar biosynthesis/type III secretory pathway protein FliH